MTPTITLPPADYWRLRALAADLEREQLTAMLAQSRIEAARTRQQQFFAMLSAEHALPPGPLGFDDATCSLVGAATTDAQAPGARAPGAPREPAASDPASPPPPESPGGDADPARTPAT